MDERSKNILRAVIESYINNGSPVGSRFVGKQYNLGICSATIRNTMSDLEEFGYLQQTHASSGRIPTDKGYKFYVNEILTGRVSYDSKFMGVLYNNFLAFNLDLSEYLMNVSITLSSYSKYIGVTLSNRQTSTVLREIELFSYREKYIVVILMTEEGAIRHLVIENSSKLTKMDLTRIASYLNLQFAGYTLAQIREVLLDDIYRQKVQCDDLIARALEICKNALLSFKVELHISGISSLLGMPDFYDIRKIRSLYSAIEDKTTVISLLDKIIEGEGVQVLVGSESSIDDNEDLSLVASAFLENGRPVGVVGLIGPKRMDYLSAIAIIDASAKFLSNQLEKK
ncbi:MAG: heat-inducible transcriptional repressor HrcA [Candidatus Magnetoovum sp. WYHC-5]|nr:heat-inducible transcriptional repressor HrcA [Candidatus Magnetoovum sp. WYHC-5]